MVFLRLDFYALSLDKSNKKTLLTFYLLIRNVNILFVTTLLYTHNLNSM